MKNILTIFSVGFYLLSLVLLLLYSYTQIDLGLVLTRFESLHLIQRAFQEIGFFQRPLSAKLFVFIISLFSLSYLLILGQLYRGLLKMRSVLILSVISACLLFFSYNAFSYDLFNYIFDAKIITVYSENPYEKRALDYPQDPMLGFMHWTHRTYPYGPIWLGVTVPLSYLSLNSIILSVVLFKLLAVVSYLGTVYFMRKIAESLKLSHKAFHVALFALNPLVIIECVVSGHNDIFMVFLAVVAFYLMTIKRPYLSFFALFLSIGVKFATALLIPVFVYLYIKRNVEKNWQKVITASFILMAIAVIVASLRTNFQPWYLLYMLPFAALSKRTLVIVPSLIISLFALFQYLPYIYLGNYDPPVPLVLAGMLSLSFVFTAVMLLSMYLIGKRNDLD